MIMILAMGGLGWFVYKALPIGTGFAAEIHLLQRLYLRAGTGSGI